MKFRQWLVQKMLKHNAIVRRVLVAVVVGSPVVALTNTSVVESKPKAAVQKKSVKVEFLFQDRRCLGIQTPALQDR